MTLVDNTLKTASWRLHRLHALKDTFFIYIRENGGDCPIWNLIHEPQYCFAWKCGINYILCSIMSVQHKVRLAQKETYRAKWSLHTQLLGCWPGTQDPTARTEWISPHRTLPLMEPCILKYCSSTKPWTKCKITLVELDTIHKLSYACFIWAKKYR